MAANRLPEKISSELVVFADCLKPSSNYITHGTEKVQNVFETIKTTRNKDLSSARNFIGGSVGKRTSVIYPDFDCIVLLNEKYPPMKEMVDKFENILKSNADDLDIDVSSLRKSSITVSLRFLSGVEMDLLPATNFSQNDPEVQYNEVLRRINQNPELYLEYSSSLAQTQIQFMRNQSGPAHQLVRIAKYWFKLCTFDKYIYGGSSIIEIICVDVVLDLDPQNRGLQMLKAFKLFLKKVAAVKTLKLAFYRENSTTWKKVIPDELNLSPYKNHFPSDIISSENFIIEPANPYNELSKNIDDTSARRLKDFAYKMLVRLEKLESAENNEMKTLSSDNKQVTVHYDKLFEPFIMCLRNYYAHSFIPTYVCIDYCYQNYSTAHVNAEVRGIAGDFFARNKEAKSVYKTVMNNLLFLIRGKASRTPTKGLSFTNGVTDITKSDVEAAVDYFVNHNFGVRNFITYSGANKDHQDYFVTLSIPYRRTGKIYAVRFSMTWST